MLQWLHQLFFICLLSLASIRIGMGLQRLISKLMEGYIGSTVPI